MNLRGSRADNVHANSGPAVDWAWVSVHVVSLEWRAPRSLGQYVPSGGASQL